MYHSCIILWFSVILYSVLLIVHSLNFFFLFIVSVCQYWHPFDSYQHLVRFSSNSFIYLIALITSSNLLSCLKLNRFATIKIKFHLIWFKVNFSYFRFKHLFSSGYLLNSSVYPCISYFYSFVMIFLRRFESQALISSPSN